MDYEKAWEELYKRIKGMNEIDSFHGLQFKTPKKILISTILKWMEELEKKYEGKS